MNKKKQLILKLVLIFYMNFIYNTAKSQQNNSKLGASELVVGQALFLKADFEGSLKIALDVLKKNSYNSDAKRLAAKSYREVKKFKECLRFAQSIPPQPSNNEDVILVGDCNAQEAAWTVVFFQSASIYPASRDSALFFMGRYYYKQGDYQKSLKNLQESSVLPSRLDKERRFMLERIKEVSQTLPQTSPPQVSQNIPTQNAEANNNQKPEETNQSKEYKETKKSKTSKTSTPETHEPFIFASEHAFESVNFIGAASELGKEIPIKRGTQTEFENAVEKPSTENISTSAYRTIKSTQSSSVYLYGNTLIKYRLGNENIQKSTIGLGTEFYLSAEFAKQRHELVLPHINHMYHGLLLPHKFGRLGVLPTIGIKPNKSFSLNVSIPIEFATTGKKHTFSQSGSAQAKLFAGDLQLGGGYKYSLVQSSEFKLGAKSSCYNITSKFDSQSSNWGFYDSIPILQFCQIRPEGSKYITEFTELEGDFIEVNFLPFFKISESFTLESYFKYSLGFLGSYVSSAQAKRVEERGLTTKKYSPFRPSSGFTTTNIEGSVTGKILLAKHLFLSPKIGYRNFKTIYSEDAAGGNDSAIIYADLLDAGTIKKVFLSLGMQYDFKK
jgi:tetratricopeptide (TPR) repeat protein